MTSDPFDPDVALGCGCGRHASPAAHASALRCDGPDAARTADPVARTVRAAVMRALFPNDLARRHFLRAVGTATAAAAVAQLFPLAAATALAQERPGPIEKRSLKVGFIPITCASPIIMAQPMGFYAKHGLDVDVVKTAGWAIIRDKSINGEYDASHMLSPMPIALTLGLGGGGQATGGQPWTIPAIENINGQAIVLASAHKDRRDPATWKGMRFGIPFDYSMHNYLLRYYLAEAGIDPDADVQLRVIPPPEMVANLRAGNIDGFLGPDPVNQRAVYDGVGFIHILSRSIWDGHPCCAFAVSRAFIAQNPNTFHALASAIIDATGYVNQAANRREVADAIAPANYLNQPPVVVEQALTGTYADGLGNVVRQPDRAGFDPFPWDSFAVWIMTQMKRWGQVKGDVDYAAVTRQVMLATDAARLMREQGLTPPTATTKTFAVMGKTFDPADPAGYLASFPMRRA